MSSAILPCVQCIPWSIQSADTVHGLWKVVKIEG